MDDGYQEESELPDPNSWDYHVFNPNDYEGLEELTRPGPPGITLDTLLPPI